MERAKLIEFVKPYYENKDIMHDLSHIGRIIKMADELKKSVHEKTDKNLLIYGAYFHGIIKDENAIRNFLRENNFDEKYIEKIIDATKESLKENEAKTIEGQILHDAHMVEGGEYFLLIKSLITGSIRGQSLDETINYFKKKVLNHGKCYLYEAQKLLEESKRNAIEILENMGKNIN